MRHRKPKTISRLLCGSAAIALTAWSGLAQAEERAFNIEPQPLATALMAFGSQSGHAVMAPMGLMDAKVTRGVGDIGVGRVGNRVRPRLHLGPVDAEIGQGIERGRRIERLVDLVQPAPLLRPCRIVAEDEGSDGHTGRHAPPRSDLEHAANLAAPPLPRQNKLMAER